MSISDNLDKTTGKKTVGLSGKPVEDPIECKKGIVKWGLPANYKWFPTTEPVTGKSKPAFDDPQQGPIPDCPLLAVLGSLALKGRIIAPATGIITFYQTKLGVSWPFGKTRASPPPDYSTITWNVPLKADGTPACARAKDNNVLWVPVYEKAYACFLEATRNGGFAFAGDKPIICDILKGDAGYIFTELTGINSVSYLTKDPPGAGYATKEAETLAKLQQLCPKTGNFPSRVAKYPIVAYTYVDSDPLKTNNTNAPVDSAPRDSGVYYDTNDELMVKEHSYSLIGLHTVVNAAGAEENFVILRNPYGFNIDAATIANTYSTLPFTFFTFDTFQYPPKAAGGAALPQVVVYNGVFALKISDFVKWFMGFCWIP